MIYVGLAAISMFAWLTYVLGGLLIVTAVRMLFASEDHFDPEKNLVVRLLNRWFLVTKTYHGQRFFIKEGARWALTPLFIALMLIESSDLLFAVDSIPAVMAISLDPFIIFTSNVFAILGLRSLYFALASLINSFRYLKTSLIFILAFVGAKMILAHHVPINQLASLGVIASILALGIMASVWSNREA